MGMKSSCGGPENCGACSLEEEKPLPGTGSSGPYLHTRAP
jgi:hypothetical protein